MLKYIAKKLIQIVLMLFVISFVIFGGLELTGVDPVSYMLSPDMLSDMSNIERLREAYGLNDPFIVRYVNWVSDILHGDFGYSLQNGTPIVKLLGSRLAATFELSIVAILLSSIIGIGIGIITAVKQNGLIDYVGRLFAVLGQSIPQFFFGICMIQIFSIKLGLFPVGGRMDVDDIIFWDRLPPMVLPATPMALALCAVLMRYTRNSMLNIMEKEYVKTARSKGIPEWKVYVKHVFRNGLRPVLVILCMRFPMLISGSVAIETVFNWPGVGYALLQSVTSGDYPVVMIITLLIATAILLASFLIDILTALLDPRVRFE